MDYNLKVKINDLEILEAPQDVVDGSGFTATTPYISNVKLQSTTSLNALGIGSVTSDCLTFTVLNPDASSYDGQTVDFYVSATSDNSSEMADIEEEVGTDEADSSIDIDDMSAIDDDDSEGEDATAEEIATAETFDESMVGMTFDFYNGEDLPVETETTTEEVEDEWELVGRYFVTNQTTSSDGSLVLTCYDGISKLSDKYIPTSSTGTLQQFYDDITSKIESLYGIECDDESFSSGKNISITWKYNTTFREALGYIAGLLGGYIVIGSDLTLGIDYCTYTDTIMLDSDVLSYAETSSGEMVVASVRCNASDNSFVDEWLEVGAGQSVQFACPLMTQSMLQKVYDMYVGINYHGATLTVNWNESLVCGQFMRIMTSDEYANYLGLQNALASATGDDVVQIKSELNSLGKTVLISNQVIDFTGEATSTIQSICPTEAEKQATAPSSTDAKFKNLYAEMLRADFIDAEQIVTRGLETESAQIKQAIVNDLEVNSINGNVIKDSAILTKALSKDLVETALGVKVFYQATEPASPQTSDIWYVTLAESTYNPKTDVIKQWNGSAWVTVADSVTDVFMANSITAREIASNTITANEVNMDSLQTNLARIGDSTKEHMELDSDGVDIYGANESIGTFPVAHFGGDEVWISPQDGDAVDIDVIDGKTALKIAPEVSLMHQEMSLDVDELKFKKDDEEYNSKSTTYGRSGIESDSGITITAPNIYLDGSVQFVQGARGLLTRTTHEISLGNITSGTSKNGTLNITKSGYYPMAIAGFSTGSSFCAMQMCYLSSASDGAGQIYYRIRNVASSTASSVTMTVHVLWMHCKSEQ